MFSLPYYWGEISATRAQNVLLKVKQQGRYLLRSARGSHIVSFIAGDLGVRHYVLPNRGNHLLFTAHPELRGRPQEIYSFIRDLDLMWTIPVHVEDDPDGLDESMDVADNADNDNSEALGTGRDGLNCHICGIQNPAR